MCHRQAEVQKAGQNQPAAARDAEEDGAGAGAAATLWMAALSAPLFLLAQVVSCMATEAGTVNSWAPADL